MPTVPWELWVWLYCKVDAPWDPGTKPWLLRVSHLVLATRSHLCPGWVGGECNFRRILHRTVQQPTLGVIGGWVLWLCKANLCRTLNMALNWPFYLGPWYISFPFYVETDLVTVLKRVQKDSTQQLFQTWFCTWQSPSILTAEGIYYIHLSNSYLFQQMINFSPVRTLHCRPCTQTIT